jgi:protoheme IX farnesyltransferase
MGRGTRPAAGQGGPTRLPYIGPVSSATAHPPNLDLVPVGGAPAGPVPVRSGRSGRTVARAYLSLTKPRIDELLLVTAGPAMVLAAGGLPPLGPAVAVLAGGALAAGAANALNCYLDRDIDRLMRRTARRPLPADLLRPRDVLLFGLLLAVVAVGLMAALTNLLAAALTLGAIAYYDLVYTQWLKRRTSHNTVAGGVCGAAPVLIGWAAVTGSLGLVPWLLFAVVFLWQPPHFYALALRFRDDYARAGVPMLPVVASSRRVAAECVVYSWLTVAASLAVWPAAVASPLYGLVAVVVGVVLVTEAHRLHRRAVRGAPPRPMRLFHWTVSYLTILFVTLAVDVLLTG